MKNVKIVDDATGEVLLDKTFSGGFHFIFSNNHDSGKLHHIRKLDNAKFGDKHWIKNSIYRPIALGLVKKFNEIGHINPFKILFIEDMDWKKPKNNKKQWIAKISKANKQLEAMTGYEYI